MQGTGKNCISTLFCWKGNYPKQWGEESDNPGSVYAALDCHIGEVQAGLWPDEVLTECEKAGVFLF